MRRRTLPALLVAPGLLLACLLLFTAVRAAPAAPLGLTLDGNLIEPEWTVLATSAGGPAPNFGVGHEINALTIANDETSLYIGVAGDVQPGYRIVALIDARAGGYTNASFGRTSAPPGVAGLNAGLRFDPTLSADYALVIGSNAGHTDFTWDLYTLSAAGGPNVYLGDTSSPNLGAAHT